MQPPKLRIHMQRKVVPAKIERKDGLNGSKRSHEDKQGKRIVRFRSVCEEFKASVCREAHTDFAIEREELPSGSDIFQSILREIQADKSTTGTCSEELTDCVFTAGDSSVESKSLVKKPTRRNSHTKPKKSILKQSKSSHGR